MAHSVIFKPENSALVRSQGPEDSMPDSGKFKDLYLNSAYTYPCQPRAPPDGSVSYAGGRSRGVAACWAGGWRPKLDLRPGIRSGLSGFAWPSSSAIRRSNRSITHCCSRTVACSWALMAMRKSRSAVIRSLSVSTPSISHNDCHPRQRSETRIRPMHLTKSEQLRGRLSR